jgi:hypothetical protein
MFKQQQLTAVLSSRRISTAEYRHSGGTTISASANMTAASGAKMPAGYGRQAGFEEGR